MRHISGSYLVALFCFPDFMYLGNILKTGFTAMKISCLKFGRNIAACQANDTFFLLEAYVFNKFELQTVLFVLDYILRIGGQY